MSTPTPVIPDEKEFEWIAAQLGAIAPALNGLGSTLAVQMVAKLQARFDGQFPNDIAPRQQANADRQATKAKQTSELYAATWKAIHTRPDMIEPGANDMAFLLQVVSILPNPGCNCQNNFRDYISANPPDFYTPDKYFRWTVDAHNAVNLRLAKPQFSLAEATARWRTKPSS